MRLARLRLFRPTDCWLSLTGSTSRVRVADAYAEAYAGAMADPGFRAKRLVETANASVPPVLGRPTPVPTGGR